MSDTKQILVVDDGVLKYYKGNNPAIIEKALDLEKYVLHEKYDTVFIKNDELLPEKEYGTPIKSIVFSAELPWDEDVLFRNIFPFVSEISVDKENASYTVIDGNLYSKDGKILIRVFTKIPKDVTPLITASNS